MCSVPNPGESGGRRHRACHAPHHVLSFSSWPSRATRSLYLIPVKQGLVLLNLMNDVIHGGADARETVNVCMSDDPIRPYELDVGQDDLQLSISVSRVVVQHADSSAAPNRLQLADCRRTFQSAE